MHNLAMAFVLTAQKDYMVIRNGLKKDRKNKLISKYNSLAIKSYNICFHRTAIALRWKLKPPISWEVIRYFTFCVTAGETSVIEWLKALGHLWSRNGHSIATQEILRILIQSIKEN